MVYYIVRRVLVAIPVLLIASVVVFAFMRATTDPTQALRNPRMSKADLQRVEAAYGLDKTGPQQYTSWLTHFVKGDWGISIRKQRPVFGIIRDAMKNTVMLMIPAVLVSLLIALIVGVYSAVKPYSVVDYGLTGFSFFGLSMPTFWFAIILKLVLGFYLMTGVNAVLGQIGKPPLTEPVFFTTGLAKPGSTGFELMDFLRHATLPTIVLSVQLIAGWGRYERASMLEVMGSDYMRTARAKGVRESSVVMKHGLRNALIPLVTVLAIDVGALFGGLIITETIFSWPGMGSLFVQSLLNGDYPIVLPWLMLTASLIIVFNLVADVLYGVLDPRIRFG